MERSAILCRLYYCTTSIVKDEACACTALDLTENVSQQFQYVVFVITHEEIQEKE